MRFSFIAEVGYNSLDSKVPYIKDIPGDNPGKALNLIAIESKSNRAFVEMAAFKNDPIKTYDNNKNQIEVAWADRQNEDILKEVASYKKHVITLGESRYEYISEVDFVNFVVENIDNIKGKRFQIVGNLVPNEYKGKLSDRFRIQSMYEITDESKKNELKVTGEFFFNKDSIDTADFAKERKIYINGWTFDYLNKEVKNRYLAKTLVFDCSKLDFENEKHIAILNYKLQQIGCAYEGGKITSPKLKKNKYYKISVICKYLNGQETIDFTENDLTPNQKMAIELGLSTLDDFKPKGAIYGDRVQIFKLVNFDLRDDYKDGCIEAADFNEDLIYTPVKNEDIDEAFEDAMNPPAEEESEENVESLFD